MRYEGPKGMDPIVLRFLETECSQCGISLGAGPCGLSHCEDHAGASAGRFWERQRVRWRAARAAAEIAAA